jgi:hypothetical protein
MKSPIYLIACAAPLLLILFAGGVDLPAVPQRMQVGVLMLGGIGMLFALLFRVVHSEDRSTRLEAAQCRDRLARGRADLALAESDLLLGRLGAAGPGADPGAQLALIRAELRHLQRLSALDDPMFAARMELLCARVDRVSQVVKAHRRALDPG